MHISTKYVFYSKFRMIVPIPWSIKKHFHFNFKSSHLQMFLKTGFLKKFAIFAGKHLCWSYFLIKLQAWRSAILLKRDSNTGFFLWILLNFEEHLQTTASVLLITKLVISIGHLFLIKTGLGRLLSTIYCLF